MSDERDAAESQDAPPSSGDDGRTPSDRPPEPAEAAADSHLTLSVPEMDCPSCAGKVTTSVEREDGVEDVDARPTTGRLDVVVDPAATDRDRIVQRVEDAGYAVESPEMATATFDVPEMDCSSCAGKVRNALGDRPGVEAVDTRPTVGLVEVTFDPEATDRDALVDAVESAGYPVVDVEGTHGPENGDGSHGHDHGDESAAAVWTSPRAMKTWLSGLLLAVGAGLQFVVPGLDAAVGSLFGLELFVSDLALLAGTAAGAGVILRNGYYSAKNRSLDIDFLMSVAILAAVGVSPFAGEDLFVEAASLAFLFNVAELLERYSVDKARDSIESLMELSPDTARVRRDGEAIEVPAEAVAVGETVLVRPGERVPMDGVVREGESAVDESAVTGESVPVEKAPGDEVFAGSVAEGGYLEVEATAAAGESTIARIADMVADAEANKTEREQFVERFSAYYTPVVVAFALLTAVVPPLVLAAPWEPWFVRGISLLVIACPCAFVISTPVTVVSGVTSAAKHGVLVKGGDHLEAMGDVDAVAFDKTGTLTKGELTVTDVVPLGENGEDDVLRCARGLEARSEHPIGQAIVAEAEAAGVEDRAVEDFESITGKGVSAHLDGTPHYAGKPGLFEDLGFDLEHAHLATDGAGELTARSRSQCDREGCLDLVNDLVPRLQDEGKTVVLVGTDEELEGVVAVADEVRPEAAATVRKLRDLGVEEVVMLTGDNERTARAVGDQVGVDSVRAGLLPEDKVEAVEALVAEHGDVAMVGDGVNDAPALATATVGIAMGAAGTDTALETADVALLADDLTKLPYLVGLSRNATGVIRENIWGSLGVKALLAVGIPLGYVSVVLAVLAGDVGMTTLVTGNAMRLSGIDPGDYAPDVE